MLILPALLAALLITPIRLEHAATATRLDLDVAPGVLAAAHVAAFGRAPSRSRLGIAVGQVRLEGLGLPGRNLGGLEYVTGLPWVRVDRLTRLRAFDDYPEAARAYWRLLGTICKGALAAMDGGDPGEVARRLRACGWYRAPVAWYAAGLRALRR